MPPRTSRYARSSRRADRPDRHDRSRRELDRFPHREHVPVDVGRTRRAGQAHRGRGMEQQTRSLCGELESGGTFEVSDDPVAAPERQVVHRPARRHAHRPVAEPPGIVLHGGQRSTRQHFHHPVGRFDVGEQRRRQPGVDERGRGRYRAQEIEVGGDALDPRRRERAPEPSERLGAGLAVGDDLREKRVVVRGYLGSGLHPRVHAGVRRERHRGQRPGARLVAAPRIFGAHPRFERVATGRTLGVEHGRVAGCDAHHPLDEVDCPDRLGDGVLDLQACVHLEEGKGVGADIDEELHRAGRAVRD